MAARRGGAPPGTRQRGSGYFFCQRPSMVITYWPGGVRSISFAPASAATASKAVPFCLAISM